MQRFQKEDKIVLYHVNHSPLPQYSSDGVLRSHPISPALNFVVFPRGNISVEFCKHANRIYV